MSRGSDFWSRRKAAVEAEEAAREKAERDEDLALTRGEIEALPDAEALERLKLPEPESLGATDDFSVFMSDLVPARLRRRALRHLWRTNPAFNVIDDLIDYNDDYTDAAMAVTDLKTSYQVGKGLLRHVEALAEKARAEEEALADPDGGAGQKPPQESVAPLAEAPEIAATDADEAQEETDPVPSDAIAQDEEVAEAALSPSRRRMKFRFLD